MTSCPNVPATRASLIAYDNEGSQDLQFLLLKHQFHCLVTVLRQTLIITWLSNFIMLLSLPDFIFHQLL